MLAKIKYDEDKFKRPLDINTNWYKLSRSKVEYRTIALHKREAERPGLSEYLDKNNPNIFAVPNPLQRDAKNDTGGQKNIISLDRKNRLYNGEWMILNYSPLKGTEYNGSVADYIKKTNNPNRYFEEDVIYANRYDSFNMWWFDVCLALFRYTTTVGNTTYYLGPAPDGNVYWSWSNSPVSKLQEYSPARDLATNTFLEFASMQKNPIAFIHKMSYVTAPYIPYLEQEAVYIPNISKSDFTPAEQAITQFGIGTILEIFNNESKTVIDRVNRMELFTKFFKALDSADWLEADKLADSLILLTDANGWAPYIGYGDLSLFIQRMNIPMEYIMTHALTDFQDELLTNAYAMNQLNGEILDVVYKMQTKYADVNRLQIFDPVIASEDSFIENRYPYQLRDVIVKKNMQMNDAMSLHIMTGGTVETATNIINNSVSFDETIDLLESNAVRLAIESEINNVDKIKKEG